MKRTGLVVNYPSLSLKNGNGKENRDRKRFHMLARELSMSTGAMSRDIPVSWLFQPKHSNAPPRGLAARENPRLLALITTV